MPPLRQVADWLASKTPNLDIILCFDKLFLVKYEGDEMTIDSSLLKQALELQKQIGREPWMDDIQTIRAMRSKKVEWGIIYTLIAKKHALEMPQELFEQKASSMLRSMSATASKKKRQRGSIEGASPQQVVFSHPQEPRSSTQGEVGQTDFDDLENSNPIA